MCCAVKIISFEIDKHVWKDVCKGNVIEEVILLELTISIKVYTGGPKRGAFGNLKV